MLDNEPVRIVIRPDSILKPALRHQAAFRHIALTDDHLPGIRPRLIGITVEVAGHAVHLDNLVDVTRNQAVVIPFLGKVHIIMVGALVGQQQSPVDIVLDGVLLRRKAEEEFMEPPHVLPGFRRTVLRKVLRERKHQRLAAVQHIDLFTLLLGKAVGAPQRITGNERAAAYKGCQHQAYPPEAAFNIGQ